MDVIRAWFYFVYLGSEHWLGVGLQVKVYLALLPFFVEDVILDSRLPMLTLLSRKLSSIYISFMNFFNFVQN